MADTKFRVETYGSGVRDVEEVIFYEVYELGNCDILQTLLTTYLKGSDIEEEVFDLIFKIDSDYNILINNKSANYIKELIHKIISIVNYKTNKNIKYALWLGDKDMVKKLYGYDGISDSDVYEYETSQIILSDLDTDGKLYGYETNPKCINKEE